MCKKMKTLSLAFVVTFATSNLFSGLPKNELRLPKEQENKLFKMSKSLYVKDDIKKQKSNEIMKKLAQDFNFLVALLSPQTTFQEQTQKKETPKKNTKKKRKKKTGIYTIFNT
ncbi:hypothetical protein ACFLYU_04225 [Candidatus Dependentiae bacterium]